MFASVAKYVKRKSDMQIHDDVKLCEKTTNKMHEPIKCGRAKQMCGENDEVKTIKVNREKF